MSSPPSPSRHRASRSVVSSEEMLRSTLLANPDGLTAKRTHKRMHSRRHSANIRSPKYESNSETSSMDSPLPHEDILRARLERVLDQQTRPSSGGIFDWFWHSQNSTKCSSKPSPPRSASAISPPEPFAPNKLQRQAWSVDNVPMLVQQPLTPPPTPPRRKHTLSPRYPSSFNRDDDDDSHSEFTPTSSPTFNARQASQQCRLIEGYVSFAQVEGLGEPPTSACPTNGSMDSLLLQPEEEKKSGWRWFWRT